MNNLYKPLVRGGAEKVIETTVEGLKKAGHDVFIVSTIPGSFNEEGHRETELRQYSVKSKYYNLNKLPLFLRLFWHIWDTFDFITARKLRSILAKENPDLVITHNLKGVSYMVPRMIKSLNIKHYHVLHDVQLFYPSGLMMYGDENKVENFFNKIYYKISKYLFKDTDKVVSPSKWLIDEHLKRGFFKKSIKQVLPNPLNLKIAKKENGVNYVFLYVGQLEFYKGVDYLIEHFLMLSDKVHNIELRLIGKGSIGEELKNKYNNNDKISFLGRLNREDVNSEMGKVNCLVVPSRCYENSPTVIYEALNNNLSVIASNLGGSVELLRKYGGELFGFDDELGLLVKMNEFYSQHRLNKKISNVGIPDFSLKKYIEKLLN